MADYRTSLQQFYNAFKQNNTELIASKGKQASNNIDAINTLLDSLIGDSEYRKKVVDLTTSVNNSNSIYGNNTSSSPALPSYNTRSPYMEIWINDIQVVPGPDIASGVASIDLSKTTLNNENGIADTIGQYLDVNFEDLELSMPVGGVDATITGVLTLYSRTPVEFLSFLTAATSVEDDPGLPTCRLRFGWNIARVDGQVEKLLTPYVSFLVMNIAMADPGKTMGSQFTLTLQDAGSAVLQNSSADAGLAENWPQEQLRIILEKFLGLRLFTLDDLLTLGENENNKKNLSLSPFTTNKKTYNEVRDAILKQNETGDLSGEDRDLLLKSFYSAYNKAKLAGASEEDAVRRAYVTDKTFFVTNQTPAVRVNSNTFENVINSLLTKIVCRWYPTYNTEVPNEITIAQSADSQIRELKRRFDTEGSSESLIKEFEKEKEKVAYSCVLIWVPFFPAGVYTSSNNFFGDIANEEGAFLLLPKIVADYSISAVSLPLIYGPGGSSLPYFYGGAQNVFARLTDTITSTNQGFVNRVGEVLDLTANFSNLLALMKATYNEEMSYRETGKFLNTVSTVKLSKEQKKTQEQKQKDLLEAVKKRSGTATKTTEQFVKDWEAEAIPRFKATRGRFKKSISPRYLVNNVEFSNVSTPNQSARSLAISTLKNRVGLFLNYPFSIGMSLLGDPYLIRQGIGAFEIINYYPTMNGERLKFNPFTSGVYMPQKIVHRVSLGDYTTDIQAIKIPDTVKDSAKAKIDSIISFSNKTETKNGADLGAFQLYADALMSIDLETLTTDEGNALNVYVLNNVQKQEFNKRSDQELARLDKLSAEQINDLITKYTTATNKPDAAAAKEYALRDFEIVTLQNMIDTDPALSSQSDVFRTNLKQKIKTVHKQSISAVNILQQTLGRSAVVNKEQVAGSSDMEKLNLLYKNLQTSRYEDIRNAMNEQTKGK